MAINRLLTNSDLGPDEIENLNLAFRQALRSLHLVERNDPLTEMVAKKVIEVGATGIRDAAEIAKIAVGQLRIVKRSIESARGIARQLADREVVKPPEMPRSDEQAPKRTVVLGGGASNGGGICRRSPRHPREVPPAPPLRAPAPCSSSRCPIATHSLD